MKKSLLALAVLGAFAGAASAQTNVTIYGVADVGIQYTKEKQGADSASLTEMANGIQSGSRLGFKGTEDLGGGLSAIFALEAGFGIDTGALGEPGLLFNRQAFVGVQGGFGAVKLGRQYTPIHLAVDSIDPFGTGLAGDMSSFAFPTFGVRMNNTINYSLPSNLGGFYGEVAYGLGESTVSTSVGRQFGLSAGYANGPINVVVAYHNQNLTTGTAPALADDGTDDGAFVGATYDFGVAKAHAAYAQYKAEDVAGATLEKGRSYMAGVSAPVGAGTVLASFQRADDRQSDDKMDTFAVGYLHKLSKRTNLYTSLGRTKVEEAGVADLKQNVFNVGVRHTF